MAKTKIPWTQETWNPVTGCTKVSPGCLNCYAEKMHKRLKGMGQKKYQNDFNQVTFHSEELTRRFGSKPKLIFMSMFDLFHVGVPDDVISDILCNIEANPQHTFQVLTKRSNRLPHYFYDVDKTPIPKNLWLGVSVEDKYHLGRVNDLKRIDTVKFISFEPLLEDIGVLDLTGIDWVIVGCESGPHRRPFENNWAINIANQCREQNVPFFYKQGRDGSNKVIKPYKDVKQWAMYPGDKY